jgi:uncharacterized protein (DUF608 family)
MAPHAFNGAYTGDEVQHIAFPLGGIGTGMICLEGVGGFTDVSLRHRPELFSRPRVFAALCVKGQAEGARVLEGPIPDWRVFGPPANQRSAHGAYGKTWGLPRCEEVSFTARFPFATLELSDPALPVAVELTGWSPFLPGDADNSSLPVAALEYCFRNTSNAPQEMVFSFHAANFLAEGEGPRGVGRVEGGFSLWQDGTEAAPWEQGEMIVAVDAPEAATDCRWFRGGWWDALTMLWKHIAAGDVVSTPPLEEGEASPGGSVYVPFTLAPGETRTVRVRLSWYVPRSGYRVGGDAPAGECTGQCDCQEAGEATHQPWYAGRFQHAAEVEAFWREQYDKLRAGSALFRDTFYDTTLPPEVVEAVAANLTILKSTTVLRQVDGRLWCFEGCNEGGGCCHGSCTHVWNYAQALAHLFPDLERSLRETEFRECQDARGHQTFRAPLPIRPVDHDFHAAADGQLGGIMKVYRDWRIGGDTEWLRGLWPQVRQSLLYCVETWDPDHQGLVSEPHHNTYDIEFWGPDGMCTSFYLGALVAATRMAEALGEEAEPFCELAGKARARLESDLWDGEYFIQKIQWEGLRAGNPVEASQISMGGEYSHEAFELLKQEGPKYQYGTGCLADGVLGIWIAEMSGLSDVADRAKVTSHLRAIHRHNLKHDLWDHVDPQRPEYAVGHEGGLLLCTWPKGGALSLPMVYSNEVWTGIEYQVASHLILMGCVEEGLEVVRVARARYAGTVRNPFDEYECGHWYGRALSSYGLLQALTGARYDAVDKVLYLAPQLSGDWRAFLCTATGYGTVGMKGGKPFLEVKSGEIPVTRIALGK